jgi:nitrate/TMAO reductase-like tetraheme cytochrome c subunit
MRTLLIRRRAPSRWWLGVAVFVYVSVGTAFAAAAEDPGRAAFLANKCNLCHSVSSAEIVATSKSEKMKGPDLKGVVEKIGMEHAKLWVTKQVEKDKKRHSKEYKGTPEDLDLILAWLKTQK